MDFIEVQASRQSTQSQRFSAKVLSKAQKPNTLALYHRAQVVAFAALRSTQSQLNHVLVIAIAVKQGTQSRRLDATITLRPTTGWKLIPTTPTVEWKTQSRLLDATITPRPTTGWRYIPTTPAIEWKSQLMLLRAQLLSKAQEWSTQLQQLSAQALNKALLQSTQSQCLATTVNPRPATGWRVIVQIQAQLQSIQPQLLDATITPRPATGWRVILQIQAQRYSTSAQLFIAQVATQAVEQSIGVQRLFATVAKRPATGWRLIVPISAQQSSTSAQVIGAIPLTRPARGWREITLVQARLFNPFLKLLKARGLTLASLQVTQHFNLSVGVVPRPATGWVVVTQVAVNLIKTSPKIIFARVKKPRKLIQKTRRNLLLANAIKQLNYFFMPTIVQSFTEVESICLEISPSLEEQTIPVFQNNAELLIAKYRVDERDKMTVNSFIKNFRLTTSIVSLQEASFPEILLTDSDQEKTRKALEVEWNNPRIHLNLWDWNQTTASWVFIATVSLLNNHGYPYRIINLLDLLTDNLAEELGSNAKIGVNIKDVGYGRLSIRDKVTIRGVIAHEVVIVSSI